MRIRQELLARSGLGLAIRAATPYPPHVAHFRSALAMALTALVGRVFGGTVV